MKDSRFRIEGKLKAAVRTMFRTGRSARYILRYLHDARKEYRAIELADVEKLAVPREVNLVHGRPVARLPLPVGFRRKVRTLVDLEGPENALRTLWDDGYTELQLEDIAYLRKVKRRGEKR